MGYNFEDENGYITSNDGTVEFPDISVTHGLRRNNYLFGQEAINWKRLSVLVGLGYVNNESFGNNVSPRVSGSYLLFRGNDTFSGTRLCAPDTPRASRSPASSSPSGSREPFPLSRIRI